MPERVELDLFALVDVFQNLSPSNELCCLPSMSLCYLNQGPDRPGTRAGTKQSNANPVPDGPRRKSVDCESLLLSTKVLFLTSLLLPLFPKVCWHLLGSSSTEKPPGEGSGANSELRDQRIELLLWLPLVSGYLCSIFFITCSGPSLNCANSSDMAPCSDFSICPLRGTGWVGPLLCCHSL